MTAPRVGRHCDDAGRPRGVRFADFVDRIGRGSAGIDHVDTVVGTLDDSPSSRVGAVRPRPFTRGTRR